MKTILVTTSVVALLATMSIALAQTPKGEQGQKETSPPAVKEGAPAEKDAPKSGEKKETPDKKKAAKETTKDAPKEVAKEPGKDGKADAKGRTGAVTTLTPEQRTKVQTSFAKHKVKSANVNITINVGVAVPRTVELYAVPDDIIVIVPGYRRYRYFVIGDPDRICIVDPETYEIVEIIVIA